MDFSGWTKNGLLSGIKIEKLSPLVIAAAGGLGCGLLLMIVFGVLSNTDSRDPDKQLEERLEEESRRSRNTMERNVKAETMRAVIDRPQELFVGEDAALVSPPEPEPELREIRVPVEDLPVSAELLPEEPLLPEEEEPEETAEERERRYRIDAAKNKLDSYKNRLEQLRETGFENALNSAIPAGGGQAGGGGGLLGGLTGSLGLGGVTGNAYAGLKRPNAAAIAGTAAQQQAAVRSEISKASSMRDELQKTQAQIARQMADLRRAAPQSGGSTQVMDTASFTQAADIMTGKTADAEKTESWSLGSSLETPDNEFLIRTGTVIPGVMISGINSDLPGTVIGQVSRNVYDTGTGKYLLIPQGTRLYGVYRSGADFGQERVTIAWQRLIFPDSRVLDIGSMPGADTAGYSGFTDLVNNHWWKLISSSILMSAVIASVSVATEDDDDDDDDDTSINEEMTTALANQLGSVVAKVIERNLNVSPTLEIRPGYVFNIMVIKDMEFERPYKLFDY